MSGFTYLTGTHKMLVGPYGVTKDRDVAAALAHPPDEQALIGIEQRLGTQRYDARRSAVLEAFVRRFVAARNRRGDVLVWLYALHPPRQFWSFRGESLPDGATVSGVRILEMTYVYDGAGIRALREIELGHVVMR